LNVAGFLPRVNRDGQNEHNTALQSKQSLSHATISQQYDIPLRALTDALVVGLDIQHTMSSLACWREWWYSDGKEHLSAANAAWNNWSPELKPRKQLEAGRLIIFECKTRTSCIHLLFSRRECRHSVFQHGENLYCALLLFCARIIAMRTMLESRSPHHSTLAITPGLEEPASDPVNPNPCRFWTA